MITWDSLGWVVGIVATLLSIVFGIYNVKRSSKSDIVQQASFNAELKRDMEYLKDNSKEMKDEVKSMSLTMNNNFSNIFDRIVRVEELAKSAKSDAELALNKVESHTTHRNVS